MCEKKGEETKRKMTEQVDETLQKEFEEAVARIGGGSGGASDADKLALYGLYKQATVGPCGTARPRGLFDFVGKAKWDAWHALGAMPRADAMRDYITRADALVPRKKDGAKAEEEPSKKKGEHWVVFSQNVLGAEDEDAASAEGAEDEGAAELWAAVAAGDEARVLSLLGAWRGDADGPRRADGATVLMTACDRGQGALVTALLERGVGGRVGARDREGSTALHVAYAVDEPDIVACLLAHGADPTVRDNDGCTPSELAA